MAQDPSQKISDDNVITDIEEIKDDVSDQVVNESEVGASVDDENKPDVSKEDSDKVTKETHLNLKTDKQAGQRGWYVIHTYTGYEDQVADSLRQRIESLDMQDKIYDVIVPIEKEIEIKNGKRKVVEKKIFPGYVLVDMIVTDDSWYVVRNTPNVTGFIGLGVRPTAILPQEMDNIKKRMGVEEPKFKIELKPDDLVRIIDGPLKGFEAKVIEIDEQRGKIKVLMNMFGRETPVSLDSLQVKKI